jgi:hypothetical protein
MNSLSQTYSKRQVDTSTASKRLQQLLRRDTRPFRRPGGLVYLPRRMVGRWLSGAMGGPSGRQGGQGKPISGRPIKSPEASKPATGSLFTGEDHHANRTPVQATLSQYHHCPDMYRTQVGWVQYRGRGRSATAHLLPCSP